MTHSPPRGLFDLTEPKTRAGSPGLFAAIARAKQKAHCFGAIHESWGAKLVQWRPELSEEPSHFTDIDNDRSEPIESRATLNDGKFDDEDTLKARSAKRAALEAQGYCKICTPIVDKEQTLFINAAIEGVEEGTQHLPWLLEILLPKHQHAPQVLSKAETTAALIEEQQASTVDSAHSDSELHTTSKQPNKKRKADALNSEEEVDLTAEEISPKRQRPSKLVRRRAHGGRLAERANLKARCADIEDIGKARRRPTAGVVKFQRHPALRLKR
jgi:hypothetical protein